MLFLQTSISPLPSSCCHGDKPLPTSSKQSAHRLKIWLIGMLLLLLGAGQSAWAEYTLGQGLPFHWYEDSSAEQGLEDILQLPDQAWRQHHSPVSLGYTNSALWLKLILPNTYFTDGPQLLQVEPNYIDDISFYYRPASVNALWQIKKAGDLWTKQRGDLHYRYPVFILEPPPAAASGYEVIFRAQSTSALLLNLSLWSRDKFIEQSTASTTFWSFYLGLAGISVSLTLLLAFMLKRRLLWAVSLFSSSYLLVACVQGYTDWLFGSSHIHWQHYLTSVATLLSYSSVIWLCAEALELNRHFPRLYKVAISCVLFIALQLFSIPLNYYGLAIEVVGGILILGALVFIGCIIRLLWKNGFSIITLLIGIIPLLYVLSGIQALLSLYGLIPYNAQVYGVWQYTVLLNILAILGLVIYKVYEENRQSQEKYRLTRELQIEREASTQQRQFIDMVSHEFRTPLAIISGAVENLRLYSSQSDSHFQRYERIYRATNRLVQLTDNCLADSRLLSGHLYLDTQPTCLLKLIREAATVLEISAHHSLIITLGGLQIEPTNSPAPFPITADSGLLRIALSNLFDNAMKYSEQGNIWVDIREEYQGHVIAIKDQGPGIAPEYATYIFDRYQRACTPGSQKGGAGLGLHIVAQIANAHGGEARLASNTPQGCQFELYIPNSKGFAHQL